MKKTAENATVNYEPEQVINEVNIKFTKTVSGDKRCIYGKICKGGDEVGSITLDVRNDYYITSFKPASALTSEEQGAVLAKVHGCVAEILEG